MPVYLVMLLLAGRSAAACVSPSVEQKIKLPGRPFAAEPSADNCYLYASIVTGDGGGAVTVLNNTTGTFAVARTINVARQGSRGLALSHTGTLLAVAAENSVVLLDVAKLNTADQAPGLFVLPESSRDAIYTQFSKDDALLFVSEERNSSIAVINVAAAVHDGGGKAVIGRIPVGEDPVGLALSADGNRLFATSQIVGSSKDCQPEQGSGQKHATGALFAIDVAKAAVDPRHAVSSVMRAGCNPVRVVASSDGRTLWVSERGDDRVMGLDPATFVAGAAPATATLITVGKSPVGLAVRPDGEQLWVADSDRFDSAQGSLVLITPANPAQARVASTLTVGAFPRDLRFLSDGRTLIAALFREGALLVHPTEDAPGARP